MKELRKEIDLITKLIFDNEDMAICGLLSSASGKMEILDVMFGSENLKILVLLEDSGATVYETVTYPKLQCWLSRAVLRSFVRQKPANSQF